MNMATISVYNKEGKEASKVDLNDAVFAVGPKEDVIHQVYVALEANRRQPWAHTKDRSDVRGGGKKPWKQKGTGRARHGSTRSPIWSGGGVTFGPLKIRNFKKKINKKMNKLAVRMCLSAKVAGGQFIVVEDLASTGKTKDMSALRNALPGAGKSTLVLSTKEDLNTGLELRNIPRVDMQRATDVNVADLLHHQYVIISPKGIEALEARLA